MEIPDIFATPAEILKTKTPNVPPPGTETPSSALYNGSTTAPLPTPVVSAPRDMPEIETMDVELVKERQGLGITIAGYTGGVAQRDGQLITGDRLMFVNNSSLEIASLDTAVQALKEAPQGLVKIGVAKHLPVTNSQITDNSTEEDSSGDNREVRSAVSDMKTDPGIPMVRRDSISSDIPDLPPTPDEEVEKENYKPVSQPLSTDTSPTRNTAISIPATERLIGGGIKSMTVETRYEGKTDADNIPLLPKALDQKIKLNKDAEALGLQVEIEEGGLNGMIVRSLTKDGTLARDEKIQPGDYLVAV